MAERGLEVEQDLQFQYAEWRIQVAGRVFFALLVIAALLGVFGAGPLSRTTSTAGSASIEYDRFCRLDHAESYRFSVPAEDGHATLTLPSDFLERMAVESWVPQPEVHRSTAGATAFIFQTDGGAADVLLRATPRRAGVIRARVGVHNQHLGMWQLVYP